MTIKELIMIAESDTCMSIINEMSRIDEEYRWSGTGERNKDKEIEKVFRNHAKTIVKYIEKNKERH